MKISLIRIINKSGTYCEGCIFKQDINSGCSVEDNKLFICEDETNDYIWIIDDKEQINNHL